MDIAGLSMSMASNNLQTKIGTAVLSKAMDTNEEMCIRDRSNGNRPPEYCKIRIAQKRYCSGSGYEQTDRYQYDRHHLLL